MAPGSILDHDHKSPKWGRSRAAAPSCRPHYTGPDRRPAARQVLVGTMMDRVPVRRVPRGVPSDSQGLSSNLPGPTGEGRASPRLKHSRRLQADRNRTTGHSVLFTLLCFSRIPGTRGGVAPGRLRQKRRASFLCNSFSAFDACASIIIVEAALPFKTLSSMRQFNLSLQGPARQRPRRRSSKIRT